MSVVLESGGKTAKSGMAAMAAVVDFHDPSSGLICETGEVLSCSPTGACLRLLQPCEAGRIIALELPIPSYLRAYDHTESAYRVWALVQNCQPAGPDGNKEYFLGVAFIGKHPPEGHDENPARSYRICGVSDNGLWTVEPLQSNFKIRNSLRLWYPFELYLARVDCEKKTLTGAKAMTRNISREGACVVSTLEVSIGDRVKFISADFDFSALAVVCGREEMKGAQARIHLEFIGDTFPIEKVKQKTAD